MATATLEEKQVVLDTNCEFGGVTIGDETARLGVKLSRERIDINMADTIFSGYRLDVMIVLGHCDDQPGQLKLFEDSDYSINSSADVKKWSANRKEISTGLTFALGDIKVEDLAKFAKGKGRIVIKSIKELPDVDDENDETFSEDPSPSLKADGPWRNVSLETLFEGGILKSLHNAGLITVGELADFTASDKRLEDIKGIGYEKSQKIEARMVAFYATNQGAE